MSTQVHCSTCGHVHPPGTWHRLPTLATLTRAELGSLVTVWPEDRRVEVKACERCGHRMGRVTVLG